MPAGSLSAGGGRAGGAPRTFTPPASRWRPCAIDWIVPVRSPHLLQEHGRRHRNHLRSPMDRLISIPPVQRCPTGLSKPNCGIVSDSTWPSTKATLARPPFRGITCRGVRFHNGSAGPDRPSAHRTVDIFLPLIRGPIHRIAGYKCRIRKQNGLSRVFIS